MRAVVVAGVAAIAGGLLATCYAPRPQPGAPCGDGNACPTGLVCTAGTCELPDGSDDGTDATDDATDGTDATDDATDGTDGPEPDASIDADPAAPALASVSPLTDTVGAELILVGTQFGAPGPDSLVLVGGTVATVSAWSDTMIKVTVPDLPPGAVPITVSAGNRTSNPLTFRVRLRPAAYINNDAGSPSTVTVMTFNEQTGALAQLGQPVSVGSGSTSYGGCSGSLVLHEATRRLFAVADNHVSVFNIDPVSGALALAPGSPFAASGSRVFTIVVNAAGTLAYAPSFSGKRIDVLAVGPTGTLTPIAGSPFNVDAQLDSIVLSQNERYLLANRYTGSFFTLAIDDMGRIDNTSQTNVTAVAVRRRPGTDVVYLPGPLGAITALAVDTATGEAPPVPGSPFGGGSGGGVPAFTADGARMIIPDDGSSQINVFDLSPAGAPTAVAGSPFTFNAHTDISCGAISRDGQFFLATGETSKEVGVYRIAGGGTLSAVAGSPFAQTAASSDAGGFAITF